MAVITYLDGVAIWKLIFYSPSLFASIYVSCRHGLMKSSGWIFLTIFVILRLIGAAAQLATINSTSTTPAIIAGVTSSIGLSPLLLAILGILSRVYYSILKRPWNMIFSFVLLRIIQTPAAIALILCIVGATSAKDPSQIDSESTVHAALILYTILLVALMLLTAGAALGSRMTHRGETSLTKAVALALPLLTIRMIFALLGAFSSAPRFNAVTGSETIDLFMAVLPEAGIVLIFVVCGLKNQAVPDEDISGSTKKTLVYRAGRGDFGTGKLGVIGLILGVFQSVRKGSQKKETESDNAVPV